MSKKIEIRKRVFSVFLFFAVLMLLILWLFQVVFLGSFYREIRLRQVYKASEAVISSLPNENFYDTLMGIARERDLCMIVATESKVLYSADVLSLCVIHNTKEYDYHYFYDLAKESGGEYLLRFNLDHQTKWERFSRDSEAYSEYGVTETIVYSRVVTQSGIEYCIIINGILEPINATESTLILQLILVSIIFLILSFIFASLLSRRLSAPLIALNNKSKLLSDSKNRIDFTTYGYKEVYELGNTLNRASYELRKTDKLQRELVANISHDLRTPLTMISGYAEVMRDIPGENNSENAQIIVDEVKRLSTIVSDVLDMSRISSGTEPIVKELYDLYEDCREICERFSRLTEHEGYEIIFKGERDGFIYADRLMISRVIYNLINNAVTHAGDDKRVTVILSKTNKVVRVSVKDNGKGIPDSELDSIWDRYYKVDKEHKRAAVGSGLGLSIVKTILNIHGATYGVDSTVGVGSRFWFELSLEKK